MSEWVWEARARSGEVIKNKVQTEEEEEAKSGLRD